MAFIANTPGWNLRCQTFLVLSSIFLAIVDLVEAGPRGAFC